MTDYQTLQLALHAVEMIGILFVWLSNRSKATRSAIDRVDERVSDLATRTQSLETRLDHMPSDQHIQDIHEKINEVAKGQAESLGEQKAMRRQLEQINEYLLKGGK